MMAVVRTCAARRDGRAPLDIAFAALMGALLAVLMLVGATPALSQTAAQSAGQAAGERGYVLGPSDAISVKVYGQNEFDIQTRVKPDGTIVMPLIGKVQASGKNVIQLADEIAERLERGNYLRDPIVNVEINEYNSRYVRVAGKVASPGLVPLDRNYRVLDVLLRSGWVREGGSQFVLLRRSADNKEVRLDTDELAKGGTGSDITLEAGDTLYIEDSELVFITGQVNRPGGYPLKPGMTIARLIAAAGGVAATGSSGKVNLKRGAKESQVDDQTTLQKDDVVTIRERLF